MFTIGEQKKIEIKFLLVKIWSGLIQGGLQRSLANLNLWQIHTNFNLLNMYEH